MTGKLLSPEAVAEMIGVSPATVRIWLRKGTLKGIKVGEGRLWRISEKDVQEFLYKNEAGSADN